MEAIQIQFEPHFHTLTDSGRSHFVRPVDAIAEFIDNSIQACRDVTTSKREINLKIFFSTRSSDSFLFIGDNGCGLNLQDITAFATFSLDQKTRGNIPTQETENSFISKFGVGSKQAGFFLGDRITVLSQKKETKEERKEQEENHYHPHPPRSKKLLKFVLDYSKFSKKYEANENVYSDMVFQFDMGTEENDAKGGGDDGRMKTMQFFQEDEVENGSAALQQEILNHIGMYSEQFAIFIVKLRPEIVIKLFEKRRKTHFHQGISHTQSITLSQATTTSSHAEHTGFGPNELMKELADIYFFHLHPEHQLIKLENNFLNSSNPNKQNERKMKRSTNGEASRVLPPLFIHYAEFDNGRPKIDGFINDCPCFTSECIAKAKDIFPFDLEVPDTTQLASTSHTQADGDLPTFTVSGCLFYFPVINGYETIPKATSSVPADDNLRLTQNLRKELSEDQVASPSSHQPFRVYWVNRLVPEAIVERLNFFPKTDLLRMENGLVEKNWKQRILGFLFLNWDFQHISNNKLKICLEPNLWINHPKTTPSYPRGAKDRFTKWIKDCYKSFDKEFIFSNRIEDDPKSGFSRFTTVILGIDEEKGMIEIHSNEEIKWMVKDCLFIGKIIHFNIYKSLPALEKSYSGMGEFTYHRLPSESYGKTTEYVATLDLIDSKNYHPQKADYTKLEKISSIKVYLFPLCGGLPEELIEDAVVTVGVKYHKIGIQILNNHGYPLIALPQMAKETSKANNRYYVNLSMTESNHVIGETNDVYEYSELEKDDLRVVGVVKDKSQLARCYYSLFDITFHLLGKIQMNITVKLPDKTPVFSRKFSILSTSPTIQNLRLVNLPMIEKQTVLTLGDYLPAFEIEFLDMDDHVVTFSGQIKVIVTSVSNDNVILQRNPKSTDDVIELERESSVVVQTGIWRPIPAKDTILFSREQYIKQKQFSFKIQLLQPLGNATTSTSTKKTARKYQLIGSDLEFSITIRPGLPAALALLYPNETTLLLKNYEIVEKLTLSCIDAWGNRTIPFILEEYVSNLSGEFMEEEKDWQLILGSSPLEDREDTHVQFDPDTGLFEVTRLQCCYKGETPVEGKKVFQEITISSAKYEQHLHNFEPLKIPLKIFPRFIPSKLQVFIRDINVSDADQPVKVSPGETIAEISFQMLSTDGTAITEDDYTAIVQEKNSWINCSWMEVANPVSSTSFKSKKKKYPTLPLNRQLPVIVIPPFVPQGDSTLDYSVELSCGGILIKAEFSVRIDISVPVGWRIVYDSHTSSMALLSSQLEGSFTGGGQVGNTAGGLFLRKNDPQDFLRKVLGVCLVDRFGNSIYSKEILTSFPPPKLSIFRIPNEENEEEQIASMTTMDIAIMPEELYSFPLLLGKIIPPKYNELSSQTSEASTSQMDIDGENLKIEDNAEIDRSVLYGFILPKKEILNSLHLQQVVASKILIRADDPSSLYEANEIIATVIAGYPASMAVACPSFSNLPHPTKSITLEISRYTKLSNLRFFLFDVENITDEQLQQVSIHYADHSYKPDLSPTGNIKNMKMLIIESLTQRVYQKKNITSSEIVINSLKFDFTEVERIINSLKAKERRPRHQSEEDDLFSEDEEEEEKEEEEVAKIDYDEGAVTLAKQGILRFVCRLSYDIDEGKGRQKAITLPPVEIFAKITPINCVNKLTLFAVRNKGEIQNEEETEDVRMIEAVSEDQLKEEELFELSAGSFTLKEVAGNLPPHLLMKALTDDGNIYSPEPNQITVQITRTPFIPPKPSKKNSSSSSATVLTEDLHSGNLFKLTSVDGRGLLFSPKIDYWSNHTAGKYHCIITFQETRPNIVSALPDDLLTKIVEVSITIEPAAIKKMILGKETLQYFQTMSLMMHPNADYRLLGKNIQILLSDEYDNVCLIHDSYQLKCFIQRKNAAAAVNTTTEMMIGDEEENHENGKKKKRKHDQLSEDHNKELLLENSDDGKGFILAIIHANQTFVLPTLRFLYNPNYLSPSDADEDDNRNDTKGHELCFVLSDTTITNPATAQLLVKKIPFQLMSNSTVANRKKQLQEELVPLHEQYQQYREIREFLRKCNSSLEIMNERLPASIRVTDDDLIALEQLKNKREEELAYMEKHCTQARRPLKKASATIDPLKLQKVNTFKGLVVDLGYVDDLQEAKVISWAARDVIDAAVVQTTVEGTTLYKLGIPTMILDQVQPFQFQDRNNNRRTRTDKEKESGLLPLPPILVSNSQGQKFPPPGNPKYIINVIKLDPDKEHFRDTLFFNIFTKQMLFDDLDTALAYREYLVKSGLPIPTIYTRDGDVITARAFLNPRGNARCPPNLDFIFGESNKSDLEFQALKTEYKMIEERIQLVEERAKLSRDLGKFSNIEEIGRRIEDLEDEINKL